MYMMVLRSVNHRKGKVFVFLELRAHKLGKYALDKQVWPGAHCPSQETKLPAWLPLRSCEGQVRTGNSSPRRPEAHLGFPWGGGITKNKTWGLKEAPS